jgi:hypothetical protein
MQPKIVSVHFPKAAGVSLQQIFLACFGDKVMFDYDHDPVININRQKSIFPKDKCVVHGHFSADQYNCDDAFLLTFLRHPISNLFSIYYYWKSIPRSGVQLHERFLNEEPSIIDFAKYPRIKTLMSEVYFGNFDMKRFDFIGFYESRDSDIRQLSGLLGVPLSVDVKENITPASKERRILESDKRTNDCLKDLLSADIAFYEKILASRGGQDLIRVRSVNLVP